MAELSLWLDYYDDIYSDFDSRQFVKRRISEDFLFEVRNAFKYKAERVNDLVLLLPEARRNEQNESIIIGSLKKFFRERFEVSEKKCRSKLNQGIIMGISGLCIMLLNSFIAFKGSHSFLFVALRVILEPGGWFLLWVSLDFLVYEWKGLKKEKDLFKELSELNIHFKSS